MGDFDILVLGGGTAGCVLAARISEQPQLRVCLVEAGPDYGSFQGGRWPPDLLDANFDATGSHDWGYAAALPSSRAKVIGGCSSHHGSLVVWPAPEDLDEWAAAGNLGWGYSDLKPYLRRAERAIRVRPTTASELEPIRGAFLEAALELGLPHLPEFNAPAAAHGVGEVPVHAVGRTRWNTSFAYLDAARSRPNLTILPDTIVDRVLLTSGHAVGARIKTGSSMIELRANSVMVTAGTYGSPAILQRSGIGSRDFLAALRIPCLVERPGVGEGMQNHPYVSVLFEPSSGVREAARTYLAGSRPTGHAMAKLRVPSGGVHGWDVILSSSTAAEVDDAGHPVTLRSVGLVAVLSKPRSTGRVRISSAEPSVLPAIDHAFLSDPGQHDLQTLAEGLGWLRPLAATRALSPHFGVETMPGSAVHDEDLIGWLRQTVLGEAHPTGTCRMGLADDPAAVVDAAGRVHGIDHLYVADASIFPAIPRANPLLTVVAAAEYIAERFLSTPR